MFMQKGLKSAASGSDCESSEGDQLRALHVFSNIQSSNISVTGVVGGCCWQECNVELCDETGSISLEAGSPTVPPGG
jgi:hypothetical protein